MTGRNALLAALNDIDLTVASYEHDHNYETGCRDREVTTERPIGDIATDLLAELERRGWKLVQIDPFAAADPPPGCCGGWVGPSGQRTMCCPVAALDSTNAPAIGGADAEPGDLVLTRQGVLDAFAERLTKIEDYLYIQDPHWQGRP